MVVTLIAGITRGRGRGIMRVRAVLRRGSRPGVLMLAVLHVTIHPIRRPDEGVYTL